MKIVFFNVFDYKVQAGLRLVNVLASKPDDLGLIPRTQNLMEREPTPVGYPLTSSWASLWCCVPQPRSKL